ncbi:hypothetical protein CYMTET_37322 [Cymbomonas tetramitiformis]|uniref:Uncharacterized protein n=1 Tax=Cymbomonas tetramitiformis TaxID=36881 RepID=A0AAE0F6S5_9CHLO|nr:hypothetical protein CYMTET_37322 [Cymbomonas tetramitiformis]
MADGIMLILCATWRVMGGHHAIQGTVSAFILRVMLALVGYWWQPYSATFSLLVALYSEVRYLRTAAIYCKLLWVGEATEGHTTGNAAEPGVTSTQREEVSFFIRTVSTLHNVVERGRAELSTTPRYMHRPRFTQRLQQVGNLVRHYRAAQMLYVIMTTILVVFFAAGGKLRLLHGG